MLRLLLCLLCFLPVTAFSDPSGTVRVVDGDTFDIGGTRVRLHAINAPEADERCSNGQGSDWACGAWVTGETRTLFEGRLARCQQTDVDRYGRVVATCDVAGRDMGEVLVSSGLAFAYRRYGMDYDLTEKQAVVAGRGLHGTALASQAALRVSKRPVARPVAEGAKTVIVPEKKKPPVFSLLRNAVNPACTIKGNISRYGGERIYHMPGQAYYDATRISIKQGERWFCTEAEARAAGWRKARK